MIMRGMEGDELISRTKQIEQIIDDINKNPQLPEEDIKKHVIEALRDESGIYGAELIIKTNQIMMLIKRIVNPHISKEGINQNIKEILKEKSGSKYKIINKHASVVARLNFDTREQVEDYMFNLGGYDECFIIEDMWGVFD